MSDAPDRPPTSAETAMGANAKSRRHQGHQDDQSRRGLSPAPSQERPASQSLDQYEHAIASAFDRNPGQGPVPSNAGSDVDVVKARAAQLLREATDLLAERTNDT